MRLRHLERGELPRYQELFSESEFNLHCWRLGEKLGFLVEGRRRENHWSRGRFWDDILMGITAEEWWAKHGPPQQPNPGSVRSR